jgi:chromosome segregation ATPase
MNTARRIAALLIMVIGLLVLLASLAGIAGTWIVRGQLDAELTGIVTAAETRAGAIQQRLTGLDTVLTQARAQVSAVEQEVQAFGSDMEQNKPLLSAISDRLGLDLSPLVERGREILTSVRETVTAVSSAIEAINAIPFISVPVPELETLSKLSQDIEAFRTEVQDLRATIDQRRTEIIEGAVSLVTTPTLQIGGVLDEMQTTVSGYREEVRAVQDGLSALNSGISSGLTWAAAILTFVLVWMVLSQVALLVLAWRIFSGQDLLARQPEVPANDQLMSS